MPNELNPGEKVTTEMFSLQFEILAKMPYELKLSTVKCLTHSEKVWRRKFELLAKNAF